MHHSEYIRKNEIHKILWDFETQTGHKISAWRPDLVIVNKKREPGHRVSLRKKILKREVPRPCKKTDNYEPWKLWWFQF